MIENNKNIQIEKLFTVLQKHYIERNCEKTDGMLDAIFTKEEIPMIIGSNIEELCIGREEVKELFEIDWKYWGEVTFDLHQLHYTIDENIAYFLLPSKVHFEFNVTQNTYEYYLNHVLERLKESSLNHLKKEINEILWDLNNAIFLKEEGKKEYDWSLIVSGMILKEKSGWRFVFMKFALNSPTYSNQRLQQSFQYQQSFQKFKNRLTTFSNRDKKDASIKQLLQLHLQNLERISNSRILFADLEQNVYFQSLDFVDYMNKHSSHIQYCFDNSYLYQNNSQYFIIIPSIYSYIIDSADMFIQLKEQLIKLKDLSISSKEQLFLMQNIMITKLLEVECGTQYSYAFRTTIGFSLKDQQLVIHEIHFSYPIVDARD